jgi:hydroxymethylpyrimidine/phosphomethylpyrimidine kinase
MKGRVLVIAGSDSGGGAGIQADIKTITALDAYAATAVTALTAQNTQGVHAIHDVPEDFIAEQIRVVLEDIGADAIKTGMLHRPGIIKAVARCLRELAPGVPVVVDPVMVAKGGAKLLDDDAHQALVEELLPLATVLTPNVPEAESLTGMTIADEAGMAAAAARLRQMGPAAVLMKGGHMAGETVIDLLVDDSGAHRFTAPRLDTPHTHGTGCTLASAIAAGIAQGLPLAAAVARADAYVRAAILSAPGFGKGHGPLNHAHPLEAAS